MSVGEVRNKNGASALGSEYALMYLFRFPLQYAGVVDFKRDTMGCVGDLLMEGI